MNTAIRPLAMMLRAPAGLSAIAILAE